MPDAANPDEARSEGHRAAEIHRALMAQEDGLSAPEHDTLAAGKALTLARELHALGEILAPPEGAPPPHHWGRLQILRPLGHGGLSEVYLALDEKLGRRVAVKRLRPHAALDERTRNWLVREGQSLARIQHAGVVGVLDLDTSQEDPLLVMEYVEGAPLSAVLAHLAGAPSEEPHVRAAAIVLEPVAARVDLARKIALALAHCHAEGVLHRDIKPSNVVVDLDFQPCLIDFGLAHLDGAADSVAQAHLTEQLVGTPAYFAPEQIDATRIGADPRSDQFAFGALFYELLSGVQPFARATHQATLQAVARAEFAPLRSVAPQVAPELEWIVQRCLERDARERYPDMGTLARDLDAFLHYRAVSAAPPSLARRLRRALLAHKARIVGIGAALSLTALILGASYAHEANAAVRERSAFVTQTRAALRTLSQPDDFQTALYRLNDVARELEAEAGSLRAWFGAALAADVELAYSELADAVLAQLSLERDEGRMGLREFQLSRWRGALSALARARPDDPRVRAELDRERVWGPDDSAVEQRLQRWVVGDGASTPRLVAAPWISDPGPGRYRWSAYDRVSGVLRAEREFTLHNDGAPLRLSLEPEIELAWESVLVEFNSNEAAARPTRVRVASRLVRWSDFERVWSSDATAEQRHWRACREARLGIDPRLAEPEAPAVVAYPDAELFAARVGARLPSLEELRAAFEQPGFAPPDASVKLEWLCEPGRMTTNAALGKHHDPRVGRSEISNALAFWGRTNGDAIGFRLASSVP